MAAQIVRLSISQLAQLGQLNRYFNGKDFSALANGAELESGLPIYYSGSIDAGGVYRAGMIGMGAKPVADLDLTSRQLIDLLADHARRLNVNATAWPDWTPTGRTIFEDRMQNGISWGQGGGTVAYNGSQPYPGMANVMRLTTGAVAGNQADAKLRTFRLADAQNRGLGGTLVGDGPKIWFGILFRMNDANTGFVELDAALLDASRQMNSSFRVTTPAGQFQVLDSTGAVTNTPAGGPTLPTYPISTTVAWHWLGMELHYQSGGAMLAYSRLRFDDVVADLTPYVMAQNTGAATVNEGVFDILIQNNAALAAVVDIGYAQLKDLTNVRNLLG